MSTAPDGRKERVQFDKITARVSRLCYGLDADHVDAAAITQKVISGVYQGVTTIELDNLVNHALHSDKSRVVGSPLTLANQHELLGRGNCRIHDSYPSGLCYPRSTYCSFKLTQTDQKAVLVCRNGPLLLHQPEEQ